VSANEIHLPAGTPMNVELISADVIHEVWVPRLGPKLDAVPGQQNRLVLEGDVPGVYPGDCAEFCGAGHAWMRLRVVVQTPQDFERWERAQRQLPRPTAGSVALGQRVVLSESCAQCHAIAGTAAHGDAGPDLTHIASRATLASGALDNTPAELRRWLADPQAIKPGCHMPNMKLTDEEREQIAVYLESLR
jgi:cytochrome c oxidase subunit 2